MRLGRNCGPRNTIALGLYTIKAFLTSGAGCVRRQWIDGGNFRRFHSAADVQSPRAAPGGAYAFTCLDKEARMNLWKMISLAAVWWCQKTRRTAPRAWDDWQ